MAYPFRNKKPQQPKRLLQPIFRRQNTTPVPNNEKPDKIVFKQVS